MRACPEYGGLRDAQTDFRVPDDCGDNYGRDDFSHARSGNWPIVERRSPRHNSRGATDNLKRHRRDRNPRPYHNRVRQYDCRRDLYRAE